MTSLIINSGDYVVEDNVIKGREPFIVETTSDGAVKLGSGSSINISGDIRIGNFGFSGGSISGGSISMINGVVLTPAVVEEARRKDTRPRVTQYTISEPIRRVEVSGSGNVILNDPVSPNFTVRVSGSGRIESVLAQVIRNLTAHISGSGNVHLNKRCENANVSVSGLGRVSGFTFTENGDITVSGSGYIDCQRTKGSTLDKSASGVGHINCTFTE